MIIRVWGIVNSTEVEFTPIPDRPGYWEGYAPRLPGLQEIEVWAESDSGLRGHLYCTVTLDYHAHTEARLLGDRTEARLIDMGGKVRLLHVQRCKCSAGKLYCETERLQKGGGIIAGKSRI